MASEIDLREMQKRWRETMQKLTTPIDFEKLEKDGVLVKKGAWYRVANMAAVPEYVGLQAVEMKWDGSAFYWKFPRQRAKSKPTKSKRKPRSRVKRG
jgi:hypothetical protein